MAEIILDQAQEKEGKSVGGKRGIYYLLFIVSASNLLVVRFCPSRITTARTVSFFLNEEYLLLEENTKLSHEKNIAPST